MTRPEVAARTSSSSPARASGVWAKSTTTRKGWPASTGSIRPGTGGAPLSPSAMVASSTPSSEATVAAATALLTLKRPPNGRRTACPRQRKRADVGVDLDLVRVGQGVRRDRNGCNVNYLPTAHVVDVDDGAVGQVRCEQRGLGGEVALHRPVVVEVVAPEVGEDRHREARAVDPVHREGVRRDLHGDGPPALAGQLGQAGLELGGLGRGEGAGEGPDHARRPTGRVEDRGDERGGRRLAVRARHADRRHPLRGVVPQRGRQRAHGPAGVRDDDLRARRGRARWSTSRLPAPAATAAPAKRCPSSCSPRRQQNRSPGWIRRESRAIPPMLADASPTILAATTGVPSSSAATVISAPVLTAGRERPCRCHRWTWAGPAGGPGPRGRRP